MVLFLVVFLLLLGASGIIMGPFWFVIYKLDGGKLSFVKYIKAMRGKF